MNPLLHWLSSPEWTHIVGALLHSLWQGAIFAAALAILMRRLANPVARYRYALATLGLVVMTSIITWAMLNAPKSTVAIATPIPGIESTQVPVATTALNPDSADKIVALGRMTPPPAPEYWIAWLAVVWMLGAVAMLLRAGIKVAGAENLRRSCQPLNDDRLVGLVAEARRALGLVRQIRVAVTDKLTSPAVVGVLVPTLILPLSLLTALTPEQIRFILLHELAHIRRGDYFANLFQLFAEALLFFNPPVWWISHQIRREREACCDALAIELSGAPADYARTLVRVAENILPPATNAALAFGDGQREPSSLADRVQRLLVPGYRPALHLTWRTILVSLFAGVALLVLSAVGTRSTVGAILSSAQSSTSNPVMLLNGPHSVTKTGKTENSSDEISNDDSLANLQAVLPLPMLRIGSNDLPLIGKLFTNGSTNSIPKNFASNNTVTQGLVALTGILTDPQFREVVKAINQRSGINSPNEDQVTQLSDRRAQVLISAIDKNNIAIKNPPGHVDVAETTTGRVTNLTTKTNAVLRRDASTRTMLAKPLTAAPPAAAMEVSDPDKNDNSSRESSDRPATFSNGGRIGFGNQELTADFIEFNQTTGKLAARGNVRLQTTNITIASDKLIINTETNTGVIVAAVKSLSTNSNQQQTSGPIVPLTKGLEPLQPISIVTGKGREVISRKLEQIKFDKVLYRELPLFEVVRILNDEARRRDPDQKGINFIVDPNIPGSTNQISPTNCPTINMDNEVIGVSLRGALDIIVKAASTKIHYSIEDYAVIFGLGDRIEPLPTRTFKINLQEISVVLGVPMPAKPTNGSRTTSVPISVVQTSEVSALLTALRKDFRVMGVDIDRPGVATFLNERSGILFVQAADRDLDTIESYLAVVTSTIIDQAGNRVNPTGESPPGSSLNSK